MAQPVVISGPSGVGKSTLLHRLLKEYPGQFEFSVSRKFLSRYPWSVSLMVSMVRYTISVDTTRQKRDKEVDGKRKFSSNWNYRLLNGTIYMREFVKITTS